MIQPFINFKKIIKHNTQAMLENPNIPVILVFFGSTPSVFAILRPPSLQFASLKFNHQIRPSIGGWMPKRRQTFHSVIYNVIVCFQNRIRTDQIFTQSAHHLPF